MAFWGHAYIMEIDATTLQRLQMVELEILTEIDRICRKNKINYSLTGGTLLGAVRHGGFIPWDDDADISMLRCEYQKFQKACQMDLDEKRFYFQDIDNTAGYRWGYGKIRRKGTVFLREKQECMPYEQGVWVDVFPRDGIPDKRISRAVHKFCCFAVRKIMWAPIGKRVTKNKCEKTAYKILSIIPESLMKKTYKKLVEASNGNKRTELVRTLTFPLPNHLKGYQRSWYTAYEQIGFEGREFMVESSYKEWLVAEFGDYMELPPVEKRKVHPATQLKLVTLEEKCR